MILLIGASGLLGHNLLALLLSQGQRVRCIVRDRSRLDSRVVGMALPGQLDIVEGSILDRAFLMKNLWGCTTAINCAGITDMTLGSVNEYREVNATLPLMLAQLMDETGGHTLIDVSTANTVDPGSADSPADESRPFGGPFSGSFYARSKRESETALLEFAKSHPRLRTVIILPGFMIGPYDRKPSSGRLLLTGYRKPLMAVPPGGKSFIDVRDVAAAIVGAISNPLAQGRYLTTGKSLTLKEFYHIQASVCGYRQTCFTLPRKICLAAGRFGDWLERHGRKVLFASRNVRQLMVEEWYDDSRARNELGLPCTPIERSIEDFFGYNARK